MGFALSVEVSMSKPVIAWQPIETAPWGRYVLVACRSGYVTIDWVYMVAKRFEDVHRGRWDDEANDALMDGGYVPEFWSELPDNPE